MTMVRKQFFIDPEASRRLKRAAASKGVSEADLIRDGIDRVLKDAEAEGENWKKALKSLRGIWKDRTDLDEAFAERRQRRGQRRDRINKQMASSQDK